MTTTTEHELTSGSGHEHEDKDLDLIIRTTIGDWHHAFKKTEKVSEVIAKTLNHFSTLEPGDYTLQRKSPEETLDPSRTLVSYHINDGEVLKLIPPDGGGQ